jgi:hypothetical protein
MVGTSLSSQACSQIILKLSNAFAISIYKFARPYQDEALPLLLLLPLLLVFPSSSPDDTLTLRIVFQAPMPLSDSLFDAELNKEMRPKFRVPTWDGDEGSPVASMVV